MTQDRKNRRRRKRITAVHRKANRDRARTQIIGLHILPDGPTHRFDAFRAEGQPKRMLTIGANPNCDIALTEDKLASWSHCLVELQDDDGVRVIDCDSTNRTIVNGIALQTGQLCLGSVLTLGETRLVAFGPAGPDERVSIVAASMYSLVRVARSMHGSYRRAAEALGVPTMTFVDWLKKRFARREKQPQQSQQPAKKLGGKTR